MKCTKLKCAKCDFDLTAHRTISGRCPECGTLSRESVTLLKKNRDYRHKLGKVFGFQLISALAYIIIHLCVTAILVSHPNPTLADRWVDVMPMFTSIYIMILLTYILIRFGLQWAYVLATIVVMPSVGYASYWILIVILYS